MKTQTTNPRRALVVIDVQNEYDTGGLRIEYPPIAGSLQSIGKAMDAAHAPPAFRVVVVVQQSSADAPLFATGSHGWQLHEVVTSRPHDHYLSKALPSAFAGTDLADWLRQNEIDTLTVVGYMTHNCNDNAMIKHAFDAGLAVEFLMDASGSVSYANFRAGVASAEEIHRVFSVVEQSRYAAVLRTAEWIDCVATGKLPERDSIHTSHQRALGQLTKPQAA